jgi:hypothetical protein
MRSFSIYERMYNVALTVCSNNPMSPDCETASVIAWMIAVRKYNVNHCSV